MITQSEIYIFEIEFKSVEAIYDRSLPIVHKYMRNKDIYEKTHILQHHSVVFSFFFEFYKQNKIKTKHNDGPLNYNIIFNFHILQNGSNTHIKNTNRKYVCRFIHTKYEILNNQLI